MALSDTQIKNTRARDKQFKLADGKGLYLLVTPSGGKLWRYDYRFDGKRKTLSFGSYPEIPLIEARKRLLEARTTLKHGIDPSEKIKAEKRVDYFKKVADEWLDRLKPTWTPGHYKTVRSRLDRDVLPWIGDRPINGITPPEILQLLRRVEFRGAIETAHRIKTVCSQIFRYAVATGLVASDPCRDLNGALTPVIKKHMAAITDPEKFGELIRALDGYKGTFVVKCALQVQALTFVRPGELRKAEWSEIDLESATWNIPAERIKTRTPHIVPLSKQTIEIINDLYPLAGDGKFIFPGRSKSRPLSENAILTALRAMGYDKTQMSGHGFRAAARTILDEVLNQRIDLVEHQLAHSVKDPLGRAYNRTSHLNERRAMMQLWADYLEGLKAGAKILPFKNSSVK